MINNVTTKFVRAADTQFGYREFGNGFPIVLFQRFRGTMDDWDPSFINHLALQNRVIVFDNVGIGITQGKTPSTISEIVADAFRFTQAIDLKSFNILGWSFGGILAQVFVLNYPSYVNKVVLVGTGPGASPETIYPSDRFLEVAKHDVNTPHDNQILFFTEDERGAAESIDSLTRIKEWGSTPIAPTAKENWISQSLAMRDFFSNPLNYFARLKQIKHHVLIGGAKEDLAFPAIDSFLLARELPNSELVIYSNAGHGFHHQYARKFGNIVNDFLK